MSRCATGLTDAEAAPPSPKSNESELGEAGWEQPRAGTNPPEDQENPVQRVAVA